VKLGVCASSQNSGVGRLHDGRLRDRPTLVDLSADDISRLFDRTSGALLGFFMSRIYDPEASVDLVAETFAAAFQDRRQFRGQGDDALRAWLYGIARHELADYFRRGQVERRALSRLGVERRALTDAEYDRIEELSASQAIRLRCADGLVSLPDDQREAVRLRVVEDQSYESVAQSLGVSEETARSRVSRGLRSLRTLLDPQESTDHA